MESHPQLYLAEIKHFSHLSYQMTHHMSDNSNSKCFIKSLNGKQRSEWDESLPCLLFWFPTKFTAARQAGSARRASAIGDRRLTLMFCSPSKSERPKFFRWNLSHKRCRQHMSSLGVLGRAQRAATVVIVPNSIPRLYLSLVPSHNVPLLSLLFPDFASARGNKQYTKSTAALTLALIKPAIYCPCLWQTVL